jgi:DNA-binding LacI/PurR family transcriptional regulator
VDPPLTTVRQNIYKLGQLAAETLMQSLSGGNGKHSRRSLVLPTELVIRSSSGVYLNTVKAGS